MCSHFIFRSAQIQKTPEALYLKTIFNFSKLQLDFSCLSNQSVGHPIALAML